MKNVRYLPLLCCLCWGGQALAESQLDLSHPAAPTVHVEITNVKGEVTITAWDRNEVHVGGELGSGAQPLTIDGSENNLSIKVQAQGHNGWLNWGGDNAMSDSTLDVNVPRGASVKVNVVSAPLSVDGIDGGDIAVNSVSGRVRIHAQTPALNVVTVSGNVAFSGHAQRAKLQTVSGDILAPSLGQSVDLQTVSGRIQANGGPWQQLSLSTVSGDVQLTGGLATGGSMSVDSMSGDVQLQFPASLSSSIHASTFSGDLRSDFGTPTQPEHGPGSHLETVAGSGDGKISIETFSGDLRIRKSGSGE
ncbi:DUF4097 family beta strand repeat-containing protein [Dyella caseinilytica]|uniref:DUF4097 family beta strand repeat protein n=1 Tax=Dyella caseinilytica TaxID=1849581 RepID=A0ABX7GRK4_9GAMM|nr:DUF4097 family beta strand repeat-containing protein [Dyella caseinilytica]QRN53051.1 DUF4097 family beta strand repeat protein [Dyella caseinilytica]GGA11051.1 hypothetical protein GCM10011408_35490 [Dyella caseinilytica]